MPNTSVSILGCGWLGLPLARRLAAENWSVKGSTTHPEKLKVLDQYEIDPYHITCDPRIQGDRLDHFFHSDELFLNIPFKRGLPDPAFYHTQIHSVLQHAKQGAVKRVFFAGSTSVYPSQIGIAREDMVIDPDTERAKVLGQIEEDLISDKDVSAVILRFSGLYGGSRELGKFMQAGRSDQRRGRSPVNLVHLDDCVEIVSRLLASDIANEIFNICADEHPSREELYQAKARQLGLPVPQFNDAAEPDQKIVCNQKIKERLDYTFIHPDPRF